MYKDKFDIETASQKKNVIYGDLRTGHIFETFFLVAKICCEFNFLRQVG